MTATPAVEFPDLFDEARDQFKELVSELASYGIEVSPQLELRRVVGTLSYYDLADGHIYLGLPDPTQPLGKLMWLMSRSLLFCETDEEAVSFMRLLVPRLVAHELGHHLRHRRGLFSEDRWHEEQVANQLATAVLNRRLSHEQRREAIRIVRRALDGAGRPQGLSESTPYHDILGAMSADGLLRDSTMMKVETMQSALALAPEQMLAGNAIPSEDMVKLLAQRGEAIEHINGEYVSDQMQYMNYHLGWLYYDLTSRQTATIDEFARVHLGLGDALLDPPSPDLAPRADAIRACYRAHAECRPKSETAARYFYKRYRTLLIAGLRAAVGAGEASGSRHALHVEGWIESLLEGWSDDRLDVLDLLTPIVPAALQPLLPHRIDQALDGDVLDADMMADTDARIWRHVALGADDPAAANTLARLALLDQSNVFEYLPAEVLVRIVRDLARVRLRAGEVIVWQGDMSSDIFVAVEGELSVLANADDPASEVGVLRAGDVFGEMAFFTGGPRTATVRAKTAALCFVLKGSDLRAMVYQHPVILMQLARSLTKRLEGSQ